MRGPKERRIYGIIDGNAHFHRSLSTGALWSQWVRQVNRHEEGPVSRS